MMTFTKQDEQTAYELGRAAARAEKEAFSKWDRRVRACPFQDQALAQFWFHGRIDERNKQDNH
jgi:hypothetical protein